MFSTVTEGSAILLRSLRNLVRIRLHSVNDSADNWWERSPNTDPKGEGNNFCNVNNDREANNDNASNANGLAPFGCIINTSEK